MKYVVTQRGHPTSYKKDGDKKISVSNQASATMENVGGLCLTQLGFTLECERLGAWSPSRSQRRSLLLLGLETNQKPQSKFRRVIIHSIA
jgi:hypothetical protein